VEFESEYALYEYLREIYGFLLGGAEAQPQLQPVR
jgi:hypothetical protein